MRKIHRVVFVDEFLYQKLGIGSCSDGRKKAIVKHFLVGHISVEEIGINKQFGN
jgi:hypothetical protein